MFLNLQNPYVTLFCP
ncbi:hypothetical protein Zm00014a_029336 [Zea mays]|uniref:Uncharacterized protein n=1 Tax=Zea mays TaxID=4577 RepID=A0A3L6FR08_MAIZE|nr:hypothetical protein Zm00014a_029336 [Zea mays]